MPLKWRVDPRSARARVPAESRPLAVRLRALWRNSGPMGRPFAMTAAAHPFGRYLSQRCKTPVPPAPLLPWSGTTTFSDRARRWPFWTIALSARDGKKRWRRAAPAGSERSILNSPRVHSATDASASTSFRLLAC